MAKAMANAMAKTILITGSTDGIGFELAKKLAGEGHDVIVHGRNPGKLATAKDAAGGADGFVADLSKMAEVKRLAAEVRGARSRLDILINNAGVFGAGPVTPDGLDQRFAVNTLAPALLTAELAGILADDGRVVSLSSAAQLPVYVKALVAAKPMRDFDTYAQSKLALTIWSQEMASAGGPVMISVNPGSLIGTKMVRDNFGTPGKDINVGVNILARAALDTDFAAASGRYYDNDARTFAEPHGWAADSAARASVMAAIKSVLERV